MEEFALVKRARRGDVDAFAVLVRRHERAAYATALSILHSEWDASDAVQEAFEEAFQHLPQLRDPTRFRPWLCKIVINKCYQIFRVSSRVVLVEDAPDRATAEGLSREDSLDLIRAVRRLDDEHRTTVALRYFCDLKVEDIAKIMDCPVGTVKSRLNRSLTKLQMMLGADVGDGAERFQEVAR